MNEVKLIILSPEKIEIPVDELCARLHMPRECFPEELSVQIEAVRRRTECKCAYMETSFSVDNDTVLFPFAKVRSRSLVTFLRPYESCVFTAVTLGMGVERYLASFPEDSTSVKMIADAAASAFIEGACNTTQEMLADVFGELPSRFSPVYGDLPLEFQPMLLSELKAGRFLGISLNASLMMTPQKSVTAIIGVKNERSTTKDQSRD